MSGHCRITPDGSPSGLVSEPAGELAPVIGRIETLVGLCTVSRSGGPAVAIKIGDLVGPTDVIETSAGGRLSIRFADGTTFTLSDNARMSLKDYVGDETSPFVDIDRGTFSFIAGKMAEAGRLSIQTPFASIRARRNGGGIGMLSLISLFFAAFEEAQAAPPNIAFLDDGKITSKDWGQYGVVELLIKATATTPEQHKFLDDPGETIVIRAFGSSVSVDSVTNSIAQMAQYQAAQQEALRTFSVGLQQGQGPNRPRSRWIEHAPAARIHTASAKHQLHSQQQSAAGFHATYGAGDDPAEQRYGSAAAGAASTPSAAARTGPVGRSWKITPGIRRPTPRPAR